MSFKCEKCQTVQENGVKATKVVVEIRNVTYPAIKDEKGNVKKIPTGFEPVKEWSICPNCVGFNYAKAVVDKKVLV